MPSRTTTLTAAGIALAVSLAGCSSGSTAGSASSTTSTAAAATASGSAGDIAFAQLMIPHHQQALDMAVLASTRATEPQVKALAAQIEAAQDPEIKQMSDWLAAWGAPSAMPGASHAEDMAGVDHSGHDMGGMTGAGMMTSEQMDALISATGSDFDDMWLQMMTAHHDGAISMAKQVLATTNDPEVKALAQSIIEGQAAEVDTMRQLLAARAR